MLIQKGLDILSDKPVNSEKSASVVLVKSVDAERDEECGVPLSKFNLNYVFQKKDPRDKLLKSLYKTDIVPESLPAKVDLNSEGKWGNVLDQGELGSCVSNSVAYCIRWTRGVHNLSVFDPSRLFIYYFGRVIEKSPPTEDTGLYIRDGYKSVAQYSVCSERNWPYDISKFSWKPSPYAMAAAKQHKTFVYLSVDHELAHLKKCLADGYPISFGFTVFSSFMSGSVAKTGQVPMPNFATEQQYGGHAVTLVGYDDATRKFKVVNSWGNTWGDQGFCYMPYDFILNKRFVDDFWTARRFS
jgi:C1A family cysteine protease